MSRKNMFEDKWNLVDVLNQYASGNPPKLSYYYVRMLIDMGHLTVVEKIKAERGRPSYVYGLTPKARSYLGLSKNWKRPVDGVAPATEAFPDSVAA